MHDLTLTFDNGPEPEVTHLVLDALRARGIRVTFFVIGQKLARPGALQACQRAHAEGHWIGNHTWSHSTPLGRMTAPGAAAREIAHTQAEIGPLAHAERWFRPFGGGGNLDQRLLNAEAVETLQAAHMTCVLWNAVPRDWADPAGWCDVALRQCADRPWSLMVLHDIASGAMAHLERFLDQAAAQGARFRQDFPPSCVPIRQGRVVGDLAGFVTSAPAPA